MLRILITGSEGLIGSALKAKLKNHGIEVSGLDINLDVSHKDYGTILDSSSLVKKSQHIDGIVHLAAISRVIESEDNPDLCWRTNVKGVENTLDAALNLSHRPWVLFTSSREVYGIQETLPVEETALLNPKNTYGRSKVEGERLVQSYSKLGLQTGIVRFSNVYGCVKDHPNRVIPAFCRAAVTGDTIYLDDQESLIDFLYLDDAVEGLLKCIHFMNTSPRSIPPINLSSGNAYTLNEVALLAKEISPHPLLVVKRSSRSCSVSSFCGNNQLANKILNWKPLYSLSTGMQRLYQSFVRSYPSYGN